MDSCCENKAGELAQLRSSQSRVLYIALAINAVMFVVEFSAGWIAASTALLGDSLDMFGDASVYALTLFVLERSRRARAGAALFKGGFMLLFAPPEKQAQIKERLNRLIQVPFQFESSGTQIIFYDHDEDYTGVEQARESQRIQAFRELS